MPITQDHELHGRRLGRNVGVGIALAAFVALVFGLTVVKVSDNGPEQIKGFDHTVEPGKAGLVREREVGQ